MSYMDDLLQQGIAAYKSGKRSDARGLLGAFVKQNTNNEAGWSWLVEVCYTDKERIDCLNQIIRINPQNQKAGKLLRDLRMDVLTRRVTRFLLIFQISVLFIGAILFLVRLSSIAIIFAFISLVPLLGALIWFYIRYRTMPIVQEKRKLNNLEAEIRDLELKITRIQENRKKEEQAGAAAENKARVDHQKETVNSGMKDRKIQDAYFNKIDSGQKNYWKRMVF
jgi:cell division protein FtsB